MSNIELNKSNYKGLLYVKNDVAGLLGRGEISKSTLLKDGYLCNAFNYNIVNRVAEKIADLPTKYVDLEGNEVTNSETIALDELVKNAGGKIFIEENGANLIALGEIFIYLVDKPFAINSAEEFKTVSPVSITPNTNGGNINSEVETFTVSDLYIDEDGRERLINTVNSDSVIWGKLPNISPYTNRGLSPFEPNWDVIKATTNSFVSHGQLIGNMGANGLLVSDSGEGAFPLDDDERERLQKGMNGLLGGVKNFMRSIITRASMKWLPIGVDPNKLEILKMQEQSLKVLCSAVNLDSKIFNDASASTYNNMSEANKSAYLDCYIPYAETLFSFFANKMLSNGVRWVVDRDKLPVLNQRDQAREKETREGIMQVQQQVYDGVITLEAGIATLDVVYGYDEDKARMLLDVPKKEEPIEETVNIIE